MSMPCRDQLHRPRRRLGERTGLDQHQASLISLAEVPCSSSSGVPRLVQGYLEHAEPEDGAEPRRRERNAYLLEQLVLRHRGDLFGVRPLTRSVSMEVAAWLIAQPRPSKPTSSITSPSPRRTETVISSPPERVLPFGQRRRHPRATRGSSGSAVICRISSRSRRVELARPRRLAGEQRKCTPPGPGAGRRSGARPPRDGIAGRSQFVAATPTRISGWQRWWPARIATPSVEHLRDVVWMHAVDVERIDPGAPVRRRLPSPP